MTTFKHALGYNKDGILGVAGILGSGGSSLEQSGILVWPRSWSASLANFKFLSNFDADPVTSAQQVNPVYFQTIASGNGIIALGFGSSYTSVGSSVIKIVNSDATITDVEIPGVNTIANGGMYGPPPISISTILFASNKFIISYYEPGSMQYRYIVTEDFETFSGPYAHPSNGFYYAHPKSDGGVVATSGGMAYISSDFVTWTTVSTDYGSLEFLGSLSDGRKLFKSGRNVISTDDSTAAGDIFSDPMLITYVGFMNTTEVAFGKAVVIDDKIVGGGYVGGYRVYVVDLNMNEISYTDFGSPQSKTLINLNGTPIIWYNEMSYDTTLVRLNSVAGDGTIAYDTKQITGFGSMSGISQNVYA